MDLTISIASEETGAIDITVQEEVPDPEHIAEYSDGNGIVNGDQDQSALKGRDLPSCRNGCQWMHCSHDITLTQPQALATELIPTHQPARFWF